MPEEVLTTWCGKPLSEFTRDELIAILGQQQRYIAELEFERLQIKLAALDSVRRAPWWRFWL